MTKTERIRQLEFDFFEQIWNQGDESAMARFLTEHSAVNHPSFGTGGEFFPSNGVPLFLLDS
jgi:hypothetical protein